MGEDPEVEKEDAQFREVYGEFVEDLVEVEHLWDIVSGTLEQCKVAPYLQGYVEVMG